MRAVKGIKQGVSSELKERRAIELRAVRQKDVRACTEMWTHT